jgi:multidrug transporter EmrE-like cation transporter
MIGVLFNAIGQIMLKFGANLINESQASIFSEKLIEAFNLPIILGLACYLISVIFWVYALTRVDVSTAYPMLSIGYALVTLSAYYLFGESISIGKIVAMCIIIFGVILISVS